MARESFSFVVSKAALYKIIFVSKVVSYKKYLVDEAGLCLLVSYF